MPAPVRPSPIHDMVLPPSLTQRMDLSDFNFLKVLGKGSFGKVCKWFTGRIQSFTGCNMCMYICVCMSAVRLDPWDGDLRGGVWGGGSHSLRYNEKLMVLLTFPLWV